MAERVTLWRSSDGKTFDTEEAAEIYENETRIFNECMKIVDEHECHHGRDDACMPSIIAAIRAAKDKGAA